MARKNPFANLMDQGGMEEKAPALDYALKGASRSILSSIDELAARADKLMEGETVVELDPDVVDVSFVRDRLDVDDREFDELLAAIRERGQDSPILVRPNPSKPGRYMIVFGHRRARVAKILERKVRAVIKDLGDREHVVAQGQENSARANLSFIEKALFAAKLSQLRYDDDNSTILTALAIDRSTLSKMLSVASLPQRVLEAIGPAKGIGRDRWYELKALLERPGSIDGALAAIEDTSFSGLPSDKRFNVIVARLKSKKSMNRVRNGHQLQWASEDGLLAAEMKAEGKRYTVSLKAKGPDAKAFGEYLSERLAEMYQAFRQEKTIVNNGD
ncbi:plasmid partitioning protein RepB [Methylosinus sp. Ce-a6]|uniref:plasmid partitioning protein RepB n=1 Tax=Methylosinus sp. Ce-a6 TaxID=2172005 RepID=UPI00135B5121|nr:plasmid partitioning protein RepB [Methylosinus sp. Ce-a6]